VVTVSVMWASLVSTKVDVMAAGEADKHKGDNGSGKLPRKQYKRALNELQVKNVIAGKTYNRIQ